MEFQSVYNVFPRIPVKHSKESHTVPDMSFTPREIIQKFSRGEKVPLGFAGKFDSEDDSDNLSGYDPQIFEEDPTRDPSFDFGDYVEEQHALKERERQRAAAVKRSNDKGVQGSKRKARHDELSASDARSGETTSGETATPAPHEQNG